MSDNEYEKFEISDYDIENEFNPFRAGRRRPTKNQQIYGKSIINAPTMYYLLSINMNYLYLNIRHLG